MDAESKVGRPSKYKPEFDEMLIEHMSKGFSYETFAAVVNVNRDTIYQWEKDYPNFSDAKKTAFDQCQMFWEKLGIDNILNVSESESFGEGQSSSKSTSLNASAWIFNMKNRFKWKDRQADEADQVNINFTLAEKMAKARNRAEKK